MKKTFSRVIATVLAVMTLALVPVTSLAASASSTRSSYKFWEGDLMMYRYSHTVNVKLSVSAKEIAAAKDGTFYIQCYRQNTAGTYYSIGTKRLKAKGTSAASGTVTFTYEGARQKGYKYTVYYYTQSGTKKTLVSAITGSF